MYPFPIEKYKFFIHEYKNDEGKIIKEVIATSTYAGKKVRATAKCSPEDEFDEEKGKKLAATRCAGKIAKMRVRNARNKYDAACDQVEASINYKKRMSAYFTDSLEQKYELGEELTAILEEM